MKKNIHDIIKEYPKVFCDFSEEQILEEYNKVIEGYNKLNIKLTKLSVNEDTNCLLIDGRRKKDNIKVCILIFYYYDEEPLATMISITTPKGKNLLEDTSLLLDRSIDDGLIKLEEIINEYNKQLEK